MGFPNNSLQFYNVEQGQFPTWSKHLCKSLPKNFQTLHDPILGVTFDPAGSEYALFWGATWMFKMVMNPSSIRDNARKRHRNPNSKTHTSLALGPSFTHPTERIEVSFRHDRKDGGGHKISSHFRPILFADFLQKGELVIVERPLVDVLTGLPPAFFRHKYGAS
jgi:U3 small nucleolar RNA-associated protein 4